MQFIIRFPFDRRRVGGYCGIGRAAVCRQRSPSVRAAGLLVGAIAVFVTVARAQTPADSLSAIVQRRDLSSAVPAVSDAVRLPPGALDRTTIQTLCDELTRLTDALLAHEAQPADAPALGDAWLDYRTLVADTLARQQDPSALPALVGAIADGGEPFDAVVGFGELAVPALIARAQADGSPGAIDASLQALTRMIENPLVGSTLSTTSRTAMRTVARARLNTHPVGVTTLIAAATLGLATRDAQLRTLVTQFVDDPSALADRGLTDPEQVSTVVARLRATLTRFAAPE